MVHDRWTILHGTLTCLLWRPKKPSSVYTPVSISPNPVGPGTRFWILSGTFYDCISTFVIFSYHQLTLVRLTGQDLHRHRCTFKYDSELLGHQPLTPDFPLVSFSLWCRSSTTFIVLFHPPWKVIFLNHISTSIILVYHNRGPLYLLSYLSVFGREQKRPKD